METAEKLWQKALNTLQAKVNKPNFESWFRQSQGLGVEEHVLTIGVPSTFVKSWLMDRYSQEIQSSLDSLGMGHLTYRIVVNESPVPQPEPPVRSTAQGIRGIPMNDEYTFQTFVVGLSNQFAHAAALAVAESPARAYNPLFIYGGVGLGKTHLMNAIGHQILKLTPGVRLAYLSTEQFTNEVITSIRYERMVEFRNRYRRADVLLVDDIQFISGKERTQEEFFHTFNTLYEAHRQIVISSDRVPKELPHVEERLRSRFEWGLIADIQPPDLETKVAILLKKAEAHGIRLPNEVALFLASQSSSNIRELEGYLIRLGAYASLHRAAITEDLAKEALKDLLKKQEKMITVDMIQRAVAEHFHLRVAELRSKRRTKAIAYPRQVAMSLCRDLTGASFPEIGRLFGGKDHTTVMHACRQMESRMGKDQGLASEIQTIKQRILSS